MPIIDTVVLYGAADTSDAYHQKSVDCLNKLGRDGFLLGGSALLEFDVLLKSRGFSPAGRMEEMNLMMLDFPGVVSSTHIVGPRTIYLAALYEEQFSLGYFDSLVAAEATEHDGAIVSTDRELEKVPGLRRVPLES
jgi:predicted nucleic acid-binding protein